MFALLAKSSTPSRSGFCLLTGQPFQQNPDREGGDLTELQEKVEV